MPHFYIFNQSWEVREPYFPNQYYTYKILSFHKISQHFEVITLLPAFLMKWMQKTLNCFKTNKNNFLARSNTNYHLYFKQSMLELTNKHFTDITTIAWIRTRQDIHCSPKSKVHNLVTCYWYTFTNVYFQAHASLIEVKLETYITHNYLIVTKEH